MKQCMETEKLHRRIKKIIGQLNAIDRMIDDETIPCENVLMQVNAAKSALHSVGKVILKHCVIDGIQHGDAEKTVEEFAKAIDHFSRLS